MGSETKFVLWARPARSKGHKTAEAEITDAGLD